MSLCCVSSGGLARLPWAAGEHAECHGGGDLVDQPDALTESPAPSDEVARRPRMTRRAVLIGAGGSAAAAGLAVAGVALLRRSSPQVVWSYQVGSDSNAIHGLTPCPVLAGG